MKFRFVQMLVITSSLLLISLSIFYSCKSDSPTESNNNNGGSNTSGSLAGDWTVDKVQMIQAPPGSSFSALMKQALVPFSEVNGSFVGELNIIFGAELMNEVSTNLGDFSICGMKFFGNVGYVSSFNEVRYSSNAGTFWTNVNLTGPSYSNVFQRIYCYDAGTLFQTYLTGSSFVLSKSTNAGQNWTIVNSNLGFECLNGGINGDLFVNSLIGYCFGKSGQNYKFYKTTDGGLTWTSIYDWGVVTNYIYFTRMRFFDESNGFIYFQDKFLKTSDGGLSWTSIQVSPSAFGFEDIFFLNQNVGWIILTEEVQPGVYTKVQVYKTNNGGLSWNLMSRIEGGNIVPNSIRFISENEGFIRSKNFAFRTTNSGANWIQYSIPQNTYCQNVSLINNQTCFFSRTGTMYKPSGIIDTAQWVADGKITNSSIVTIVNSSDRTYYANGSISRNSSDITFNCYNYSGGGPRFGAGSGTFSFDSGFLNLFMNFPNNEKWKIKLRRR